MLDSCLQQAGVSASRFLDIDPKAAGQDDKLTVMLDLFQHLGYWILNPLLLEGMTNRIRANLSSRGVPACIRQETTWRSPSGTCRFILPWVSL
jgi:hypothetical protein